MTTTYQRIRRKVKQRPTAADFTAKVLAKRIGEPLHLVNMGLAMMRAEGTL